MSNDNGEFIIPISDPGMYLSRASRIGYATIETPSIEIGDREVV